MSLGAELGARVAAWVVDRHRRRRLAKRDARVRTALAEAAEDDPAFAADAVLARAREIAEELGSLCGDAGDEAALRAVATERCAADLAARGRRERAWTPSVWVQHRDEVFLVGVENLQDDELDRVRVATVADSPEGAESPRIIEFWSLARGAEEEWLLADTEAFHVGRRHLDAPLVASPWDAAEVADRATLELAGREAAARAPEELLSADAAGLAALRDLALADARWGPEVLTATVRRLLDAWVHAVVEGPAAFDGLAAAQAAADLVHPRGDGSRVEVAGLRVERLEVEELRLEAEPPAVRLIVHLVGRRALLNVGGDVPRIGSTTRDRGFEERWLLERSEGEDTPWRLAEADPIGWQRRRRREAARRRRAAGG